MAPVTARQLAVLRMVPIARHLAAAGEADGLAVWRLRFRYRGWNPGGVDDAHPVADVRWAVRQLREQHGDVPVVLVGHSMGGRAALRAADEPGVVGLVGLAPWVTPDEPYKQVIGRRLLVVHGTRDRMTSATNSKALVDAVRADSALASGGRDLRAPAPRRSRDAAPVRDLGRPDGRFCAARGAWRAPRRPASRGNRGRRLRHLERVSVRGRAGAR